MITLLIGRALSTWYNFSEKTFPGVVRNSWKKPLFMLCYAHYCPHCHGLPEGFINYNKTLGDRDDIYVSKIDCASEPGCGHFHVTGTPKIVLVRGSNHKYWPVTGERGPNGWNRWINEQISPNLREITSDEELLEAKREPTSGGTTFYLEVPKSNHPLIKSVRELSKKYRLYNDTFVYRVRPEIKLAKLYAYPNEHCYSTHRTGRIGLETFISFHKFGLFRKYDYDDFRDAKFTGKTIIYVVEKEMTENQKAAFRDLPKGHCNMNYGWAKTDEDDKKIHKLMGTSDDDLPLLYSSGFRLGKNKIFKGSLSEANSMNFIDGSHYNYYLFPSSPPGFRRTFFGSLTTVITGVLCIYYLIKSKRQKGIYQKLT